MFQIFEPEKATREELIARVEFLTDLIDSLPEKIRNQQIVTSDHTVRVWIRTGLNLAATTVQEEAYKL